MKSAPCSMERIRINWGNIVIVCLFSAGFLIGCATQKPVASVSQYRFEYEGNQYRIRSVMSERDGESYNQLMAETFVAADYDQDRLIDMVELGNVSVKEAQKIYDYGLAKLEREDRLRIRGPRVDRFVWETDDFSYEISSFRPRNKPPFNEFKIFDERQVVNYRVAVAVDHNADGSLDEVLSGDLKVEDMQSAYEKIMQRGLKQQKLIRENNSVLVRKQ